MKNDKKNIEPVTKKVEYYVFYPSPFDLTPNIMPKPPPKPNLRKKIERFHEKRQARREYRDEHKESRGFEYVREGVSIQEMTKRELDDIRLGLTECGPQMKMYPLLRPSKPPYSKLQIFPRSFPDNADLDESEFVIRRFEMLSDLPSEIIWQILTFLDVPTIGKKSLVSKMFCDISKSETFWKEVFSNYNAFTKIEKPTRISWREHTKNCWKKVTSLPPMLHVAQEYDILKVVLLGEYGVGRSSLLLRYVDDQFRDNNITIGVEFGIKMVGKDELHRKRKGKESLKPIKMQIWDTCGEERYQSITRSYYRGAGGFVVCFDLTNRASFGSVRRWVKEFRKNSDRETDLIVVVGNKLDLKNDRQVSSEELAELGEELNCCGVFETSAKDGTNVNEVFLHLAREAGWSHHHNAIFKQEFPRYDRPSTTNQEAPGWCGIL